MEKDHSVGSMRIAQLKSPIAHSAMEEWRSDQPSLFRAVFPTVSDESTDIYLGIYRDAELQSVITLQPRAKGVYEVHLALKRGVGAAQLLPAFFSVRQQLFGNLAVREICGWVPTLHLGIQRLATQVGFFWNGVTLLQLRGKRLVEWRQLILRAN